MRGQPGRDGFRAPERLRVGMAPGDRPEIWEACFDAHGSPLQPQRLEATCPAICCRVASMTFRVPQILREGTLLAHGIPLAISLKPEAGFAEFRQLVVPSPERQLLADITPPQSARKGPLPLLC